MMRAAPTLLKEPSDTTLPMSLTMDSTISTMLLLLIIALQSARREMMNASSSLLSSGLMTEDATCFQVILARCLVIKMMCLVEFNAWDQTKVRFAEVLWQSWKIHSPYISACPPNFVRINNICLHLNDGYRNYGSSENYCEAVGGRLYEPRCQDTDTKVGAYVKEWMSFRNTNDHQKGLWMGIEDRDEEGRYV